MIISWNVLLLSWYCRNRIHFSSTLNSKNLSSLASVLIHQKVINNGASHRNRYNTGDLFHLPPDVIACKLWLWPCDLDTFAPPFNKNLDIWGISIDRWPTVLPFSFSQNLIANMSNEFQIFLEQFKLCSCSGTKELL